MPRHNLNDLLAFRAVARERSFTRAAALTGVSPSALSHTIRALEERLGLRLLTRTTRSVAPTEAGERLLATIGPHLDEIEAGLAALTQLRDKAAGALRTPIAAKSRRGRSASPRASMRPRRSCGRRSSRCCRTIPTSRSRSASMR